MVMEKHKTDFRPHPTLDDIIQVDAWAREQVDACLHKANAELKYMYS